jgi:hypothetical protein
MIVTQLGTTVVVFKNLNGIDPLWVYLAFKPVDDLLCLSVYASHCGYNPKFVPDSYFPVFPLITIKTSWFYGKIDVSEFLVEFIFKVSRKIGL